MQNNEINIRDPFVLNENGMFYMYGTRAANFGIDVGGFDVYTSTDLENWSSPKECFNSAQYGLNRSVNWAPEVHKYKGSYYMFATFEQENGNRGTHILKSESPYGPFKPHSDGAVTPFEWESLDGTLYIEKGEPYLVFCHEHTQLIDGTMCYVRLNDDLKSSVGNPVTMFTASSPYWVEKIIPGKHYITDGPFMYRTKTDELLMIWSSFIKGKYAECVVKFTDGTIKGSFEHQQPLIDNDGGHGMLFSVGEELYLTYHTPNTKGSEHPAFRKVLDCGDRLVTSE